MDPAVTVEIIKICFLGRMTYILLAIRAPCITVTLKSQQKSIKLFLQSKLFIPGLFKYPLSSKQTQFI